MLTASVFHGLAANFGLCACALHVAMGVIRMNSYRRNSALARKRRMVIVSAEFVGKQSHEIGPGILTSCIPTSCIK